MSETLPLIPVVTIGRRKTPSLDKSLLIFLKASVETPTRWKGPARNNFFFPGVDLLSSGAV